MWTILTNPIVSHLVAALVGAAGAWWATHRTILTTVATAIEGAVTALKKSV